MVQPSLYGATFSRKGQEQLGKHDCKGSNGWLDKKKIKYQKIKGQRRIWGWSRRDRWYMEGEASWNNSLCYASEEQNEGMAYIEPCPLKIKTFQEAIQ